MDSIWIDGRDFIETYKNALDLSRNEIWSAECGGIRIYV